MQELNHQEKALIVQYIENENKRRSKPLPEKRVRRKKSQMQIPAKIRQTRVAPSSLPSINVMFTNADQLTSGKKVELIKLSEREQPFIVAVSEMKPKNSKEREMLDYNIPDYSTHPVNLDPSINTGRGIAVYTHNSIEKSAIQIKVEARFEKVCLLEIRLRGGDNMIFGCFYRSPTPSEKSKENNDNLNNLLRYISRIKYSHTCLLGDFNYRDINWSACVTPHNEDGKEAKFIETIRDCFLHQYIIEPTRRRGNDEASTIDLVLTDEAMQVSDIVHHAPLGKSDHSVITFKFH